MSNILRFQDFSDSDIRVTEDGRFSVFDVIKFCCKTKGGSERKVLSRLTDKYPEICRKIEDHKFEGKGQKLTPVATESVILEILERLGYSPSQKAVTSDKFYSRTESQIIAVLTKAFYDCEPCHQFYCNGYRIDLYLAKHRIAVECDECEHSAYCKKKESIREKLIKTALGCSFVRFDPYAEDFNIGNVIADIRKLVN